MSSELSKAQKIGVGIGVGVFGLLSLALIGFLYRWARKQRQDLEQGRTIRDKYSKRESLFDKGAPIISKPLQSPSKIRSSALEPQNSMSSLNKLPPPINPKSSRRPSSLVLVSPILIDKDENTRSKTPALPEKSARRRTLIIEDEQPALYEESPTEEISMSRQRSALQLCGPSLRSPGTLSLRPLPLFSPQAEDFNGISEEWSGYTQAHVPKVPIRATARMSGTPHIPTNYQSEMVALREENERLRRETNHLKQLVVKESREKLGGRS